MQPIREIVIAVFLVILLPVSVFANSVEGTIQGFTVVTKGKFIPYGKEDPMVFVVRTRGKDYYFVPNVDRAVLAKYINQRVRVSGTVASTYPSIEASEIEVYQNGAWKSVWDYGKDCVILQESLKKNDR